MISPLNIFFSVVTKTLHLSAPAPAPCEILEPTVAHQSKSFPNPDLGHRHYSRVMVKVMHMETAIL